MILSKRTVTVILTASVYESMHLRSTITLGKKGAKHSAVIGRGSITSSTQITLTKASCSAVQFQK